MGRPEGLLGLVLFGLAGPKIRPTCRSWAVRQAQWPVEAWPGWHGGLWRHGPVACGLYRPVPGRAGPLLIFE